MGPLLLFFAILFNVVANGLFRMGAAIEEFGTRKVLLIGAGLLIGLANTLCYIKSLETLKLGTAYAVFAAASTILIAGVSVAFFGEGVTLQKGIGLATICVGLLILWGT